MITETRKWGQVIEGLDPYSTGRMLTSVMGKLIAKDWDSAEEICLQILKIRPECVAALSRLAEIWRFKGDSRADELTNYSDFVLSTMIQAPAGWPDLDSYISDLNAEVSRPYASQPVASGFVRNYDMSKFEDPSVLAIREAIDPPINEFLAKLGHGDDRVRRWNNGTHRFNFIRSHAAMTGNGQPPHPHQHWFTGILYLNIPDCMTGNDEQGALTFGGSDVHGPPVSGGPGARFQIKPRPGLLVLFPGFMNHAVEPFDFEPGKLRHIVLFELSPS